MHPATAEYGSGVLARITLQAIGPGWEPPEPDRRRVVELLSGANLTPSQFQNAVVGVNHPDPCGDDDGDGILNAGDACPVAETLDTDANGNSNSCDPDDDDDFVSDIGEGGCEGDGLNRLIRPERLDVGFAGRDDDGDQIADEPLPQGAEGFDCDGDGYTGSSESGTPLCGDGRNEVNADDAVIDDGCPGGPPVAGIYSEAQFNIGLSDQDPCGLDGWPSDLISGGIPDSTNRITIGDIVTFLAPQRRLETSPGDALFDSRWDLIPGRGLFSKWIAINDLTALVSGASGHPPITRGVKALNAGPCPWQP